MATYEISWCESIAIFCTVEANSKEEALEIALEDYTLSDMDSIDLLSRDNIDIEEA